jgi:hypothetical protein
MPQSSSRNHFYNGPERRKEPQLATVGDIEPLTKSLNRLSGRMDRVEAKVSESSATESRMISIVEECRNNISAHVNAQQSFNRGQQMHADIMQKNYEAMLALLQSKKKDSLWRSIPVYGWVLMGIGSTAMVYFILTGDSSIFAGIKIGG